MTKVFRTRTNRDISLTNDVAELCVEEAGQEAIRRAASEKRRQLADIFWGRAHRRADLERRMGRVAAFIGLNIIGALIGVWGLSSVFAGFAIVAAFGSVIAALFITETRFRTLEEISP